MYEKETLGNVILNRRKEFGIDQRKHARMIGLNHATMSRFANNLEAASDVKTIKAIAEAFKVDINYILSLNGTIDFYNDLCLIARATKEMDSAKQEQMMNYRKKTFKKEFKKAEDFGDWK